MTSYYTHSNVKTDQASHKVKYHQVKAFLFPLWPIFFSYFFPTTNFKTLVPSLFVNLNLIFLLFPL